jgi:hypothetical protein
MWAGVALLSETFDEERLQQRRERAHCSSFRAVGWSQARSSRSAASARSSGVASKYQNVCFGSTCPRNVESSGSCGSMSFWTYLGSTESRW